MSFIARAVSRVVPAAQSSSALLSRNVLNSAVAASSRNFTNLTQPNALTTARKCPIGCSCCSRGYHTKADEKIVNFLKEEIFEEKKNLKGQVPSHLGDFSVKVDKSHVNLYRKFNDEEININLYVTHTVSAASPDETGSVEDEAVEFTSKPEFEVDVAAGGKMLSLSCAFTDAEALQEGEGLFGISELLMREGGEEEGVENQYAVSGEVMDESLYEMMLEYLAERGITEDFVDRLSELCTNYEHSLYVGLLGGVHDFVARK